MAPSREVQAEKMLKRHPWLATVPTVEDRDDPTWLRLDRGADYTVTEKAIRYTLRRYARLTGRVGETIMVREYRGGPPTGILARLVTGGGSNTP